MKKKDRKKTELLRILSDVEKKAQEFTTNGREIVEQGQYTSDIVSIHKRFTNLFPDDSFFPQSAWDKQISNWQRLSDNYDTYLDRLDAGGPFVSATDSSALTAVSMISSGVIINLPLHEQVQAHDLQKNFELILEKSNRISEINDEIVRLNLNNSAGTMTISSMLEQAEKSLKLPSISEGSPTAVLIPLREAINSVFAALLRKRPHQEKSHGDRKKVISICKQLGHKWVDDEQIEILASEANDLKDLLSSAKDKSLQREQVRELFNRGLLFLRSFLRIIDERKMKE